MRCSHALAHPMFVILIGLSTLPGGLAASGCGPTGGPDNSNNTSRPDGGADGALPDAAPRDGALPDAGGQVDAANPADAASNLVWDAGGVNQWQIKAVNSLLLTDPARLATHPTLPTTLAALPAATQTNRNMVVFRSTDGLTFTPVTIVSFGDSPGFFGTPRGLAYDPRNGDVLVAALQPVPPPNTELAMVLAWSENAGLTFTHAWGPWATPWPPEEMRFVDGSPSELVWRSGTSFHFSGNHGSSFGRSETLNPLPAGCSVITGFDMPRNNHDRVAIWCSGGGAFLCDLVSDGCPPLPVTGSTLDIRFAPGNPLVVYLVTTDRLWKSIDAGVTFSPVHSFSADVIRVDPNDAARACALRLSTGELRCTRDGGVTWMVLTPGVLDGATPTVILDFAFAADGRLWALGHPGVVSHPAP